MQASPCRLLPKGRYGNSPASVPTSDERKAFISGGKSPVRSCSSAPKHTQSQKDICPKGLSQRKSSFFFKKKKCFSSRRNVCISSSSGGGFMPSLPSDPLCTSLIVSHLVSGIHKGPGPAPLWPFFRQFCVFVGPRLRLPPARPDRTHASRCQAQGHLRSLRGGEQRTRPGRASRTFCQPKTDR